MAESSTSSRKRHLSLHNVERQGPEHGCNQYSIPVFSDTVPRTGRPRREKWSSGRLFRSRNIVISTTISLATLILLIWLQRTNYQSLRTPKSGQHVLASKCKSDPDGHTAPLIEWPSSNLPHTPQGGAEERFLTYFPHSGFHNQRVALENALTLAKLLNRTLLVPPIWLGLSIPWIEFDKMYDRLLMATKVGLDHCRNLPQHASAPHECLGGYWDYTTISWDSLVDLKLIMSGQPLIHRHNTSYAWLNEVLGIDIQRDVVCFKDSSLYDFRIFDSASDTSIVDKFKRRLNIDNLRAMQDVKLLHFGSLFATKRLRLTLPEPKSARREARRSMVLSNALLTAVKDAIRERLGGSASYLSAHIRMGDGTFRNNAFRSADMILHQLFSRVGLQATPAPLVGVSLESAGISNQYESILASGWLISRNDIATYKNSSPHARQSPPSVISTARHPFLHKSLSCRAHLHAHPLLLPLNTPLYLATDSRDPLKEPALRPIFDLFPCSFTLADFVIEGTASQDAEMQALLAGLSGMVNGKDGVPLKSFLLPFIDAMVAASGRDVVGTPGSTFSSYAVDVLHRVYHGWEIKERGK